MRYNEIRNLAGQPSWQPAGLDNELIQVATAEVLWTGRPSLTERHSSRVAVSRAPPHSGEDATGVKGAAAASADIPPVWAGPSGHRIHMSNWIDAVTAVDGFLSRRLQPARVGGCALQWELPS